MPVVTTTVEVHDNLTEQPTKYRHTISDTTSRGEYSLAAAVRHSLYFIPMPENMCKETGMARSDYDIINLSLEHD